ncbi:MAG: DUF3304 domain-containing protein, partial [Cytophagaceae bacterium]
VISAFILPTFSACASTELPVAIHAVNYSNQEFEYVLQDPAAPENSAGGEGIGRFAAGGTMCCYSLPKKWRPGLQTKINYTYYLPEDAQGNAPAVRKSALVDIPKYAVPEELWVVRDAAGGMSVISSNFQPNHPKWPGRIKGWPVPSLEYRRELWQRSMDHEAGNVQLYVDLLSSLKKEPLTRARDAWPLKATYDPALKSFTGPTDPRFIAYLKRDYERSLKMVQEHVDQLNGQKP